VVLAPIEAEPLPPMAPGEGDVAVRLSSGTAASPGTADILVSLVPPDGTARTPCDICCVVDVSTSMGSEAMVQNEAGVSVRHGLTLLDIVKHALRTIIHVLDGRDRFAVVCYSDTASTILELTPMTQEGKSRAELRLTQLQPDGMTNLWAGLDLAGQILSSEPGRLQHMLLLTDGVPNIHPPRGLVPMLERLKKKSGGRLNFTINTFGFGYELDSQMLLQIANIGSGSYAFIPDAGFVGTVFVNAVTNLLVAMATHVTLVLEPLSGVSFSKSAIFGGRTVKQVDQSLEVELEPLQFGQTKDVILRAVLPEEGVTGAGLRAALKYRPRGGELIQAEATKLLAELSPEPSFNAQQCRCLFIDGVQKAMDMMVLTPLAKLKKEPVPLSAAQEFVAELVEEISHLADPSSEALAALLEDVSGQVAEAFSKEEWYNKWGIHFLPSLLCAHRSQQCNNFKDPGVQHYGGEIFQDLRDSADDIFCNLEPPKPQARPAAAAPASTPAPTASTPSASTPAPPTAARSAPAPATWSMADYYHASGG